MQFLIGCIYLPPVDRRLGWLIHKRLVIHRDVYRYLYIFNEEKIRSTALQKTCTAERILIKEKKWYQDNNNR